MLVYAAGLLTGLFLIFQGVHSELGEGETLEFWATALLVAALAVALTFEFVNGFHDTANAAATVIYTRSLRPSTAVVWSGLWNFIGIVFSTGAVAFGVVSLLPVELILQTGEGAGFAMVFALLLAASAWNLGTWYFGLPVSSSHALIGAIMGVGLSNQWLTQNGQWGVDWSQLQAAGLSLLISPFVGFCGAALLLVLARSVIRSSDFCREPSGQSPPLWIRALLIVTCTGVSFAHGSNDGQKGMGLIMLILIGFLPATYAISRSADDSFAQLSMAADKMQETISEIVPAADIPKDPRLVLSNYRTSRELTHEVIASLSLVSQIVVGQVAGYGGFNNVPAEAVAQIRSDMYLVSYAIALIIKSPDSKIEEDALSDMTRFKDQVDKATQFIPLWVKMAVAIALGLGTTVGWKRVVVTVGERIGTSHLTYAQGSSAEIVAMATILAADSGGLPVSTTQVLSSGIAGAMTASGGGLQLATVRNLGLAWVLTLPATIAISGTLYLILRHMF